MNSRCLEMAEFLGFTGPIDGRRASSLRWPWRRRREKNCRQTLYEPFSRTYEQHKLRWMLPRESWACGGGLHWCTVGGLARCLQSGLRSGPRAGRQHQPRDPDRRRRAWHSNGAQRLLNDALIFLGVRRHGCVLLTRNVADFNLFQQLVPDARAPFYRD